MAVCNEQACFQKKLKENVYQQRERESIKLFLRTTISKLKDLSKC